MTTAKTKIPATAAPTTLATSTNRKLAKAITGADPTTPVQPSGPVRLTRGVVQRVPGDGTVIITLSGTSGYDPTNLVTADSLDLDAYLVGSVVEVLIAPPRTIVLGVLATALGKSWLPMALQPTWTAFGGGFSAPAYRVLGNILYCKGLIKNAGVGHTSSDMIWSCPSVWQPTEDRVMTAMGSINGTGTMTAVRVNMPGPNTASGHPAGDLNMADTIVTVQMLSLDGCYWLID